MMFKVGTQGPLGISFFDKEGFTGGTGNLMLHVPVKFEMLDGHTGKTDHHTFSIFATQMNTNALASQCAGQLLIIWLSVPVSKVSCEHTVCNLAQCVHP